MKVNKTTMLILLLLLLIFIILYIFLKKKFNSTLTVTSDTSDTSDVKSILQDIKKQYNIDIARNVEKIYRFETAHFTSNIYRQTYSAGMLAFADTYPYGWTSLKAFWNTHPQYKPSHVYKSITSYKYVAFPTVEAAMHTLAYFLYLNNNNPGRWYSLEPDKQAWYNSQISKIQTYYV